MFPMMLVLSRACTLAAHAITQCNFHPFTFYLPFHTSPPVDQCPIYAPSNCTMGLDMCARHPLFGRTDPYYTVICYSSCGLNKRPAATLAFHLSVSVLSSQYLFHRGPIWVHHSSFLLTWSGKIKFNFPSLSDGWEK